MPHRHLYLVPLHSRHTAETGDLLIQHTALAQEGLIHGVGLVLLCQGGDLRFASGGSLSSDHALLCYGLKRFHHLMMRRSFATA